MTIAIGALYGDGAIICADTRVVASDGATTTDQKVSVLAGEHEGMFVIADAAEDGNAAKMLAREIRDAACGAADPRNPTAEIKAVMTSWHNSYGTTQPPHLQFLLARVVPPYTRMDNGTIYLCEPPATVMETTQAAIGRGSRAVDPLLSILYGTWEWSFDLQATLLRLAFLMYRAKKDEASACGGDTHAVVLSNHGALAQVSGKEMAAAEDLARQVDMLMMEASKMITSCTSMEHQQKFLRGDFATRYAELAAQGRNMTFPSTDRLNIPIKDCGCARP